MKLEFLPDGSVDCPLVRLYDFDTHQAVCLRLAFDQLANGTVSEVLLHEQEGIESISGCKLHLRSGKRDVGVVQCSASSFDCILTKKRWADVVSLTEPFCRRIEPNTHQWLNEDGPISLLLSPNGMW